MTSATALAEARPDAIGETRPVRRRIDLIEVAVLYGAFALAVSLTFAYSPDDPFITLRYAWNLLHGKGLVFNPGQKVDGATSPAGVVLAVLALVAPFGHALLKLKLLSLLFGALTMDRSRALVSSFRLPRWGRVLALAAVGLSAPFAISSASGLETTVESYAAVALLVELVSGRAFSAPRRAMAFAALAVLARPEAPLLIASLSLVAGLAAREYPWRSRLRWTLAPLATEGVLLVASRVYFGYWLPNTFYAKGGNASVGIDYVRSVIYPGARMATSGAAGRDLYGVETVLLLLMHVSLLAGVVVALLRWRSGTGYLLSAVVAQVLFAVHSGGDWMMGGRFLLPCLVGIYILPVIGLVAVGERLERWVPHRGLAAVAAVAVTWTALYPYIGVQPRDPVTRLTAGLGDSALIGVGGYDWSPLWESMPTLLSCAGAGDLVAVTEAGVGPFVRPDLRVLDLRGLTDSRIAHAAPDSMKSYAGVRDVDWWQPTSPVGRVILADQPELIVTIDTGPAVALGGEYTGVVAYQVRDQAVFVYARSGTTCAVPPLPFPPEGFS